MARRVTPRAHALEAPLVVSLTSYPRRFAVLHLTLSCLLRQTIRPDAVILWIADADFDQLPAPVLKLQKQGLVIRRIHRARSLKSFKKIIPALREMPDAYIATADDDLYYPADWLEGLVDTVAAHPGRIAAQRAHRILYLNDGRMESYERWKKNISGAVEGADIFGTGAGGILYPPGSLHPDVLREDLFLTLCPLADDLWLYWMAQRLGTVVRHVGPPRRIIEWPGSQVDSLRSVNLGKPGESGNDRAIAALINHFGPLPARNELNRVTKSIWSSRDLSPNKLRW